MKKILSFIQSHGFVLMGIGMVLALAGIFVLMEPRNRLGITRSAALAVGITGFVLYFIGRVGVAMERRRPRKRETDDDSSDERPR
ncbi:MAG: hypothetical protein GF331_17960 [Chitinivibrionales bacterium]|nr:hypothetical protein [Chitinivibrionales bacterium]